MYKTPYKSVCILPDPLNYEFFTNLYKMYDLIQVELNHADCVIVNHDSNSDSNRIARVTHAIYVLKKPIYIVTNPDVHVPVLWKQEHVMIGDKFGIHEFFATPEHKGRIFVIEGGDGAGKMSQTALLMQRLEREDFPVKTIDFPHNESNHGMLIREVLAGKYGDLKNIDPFLLASLYAQNRWSVKHILDFWISRGYNIILDRYIISNIAYQGAHEYKNRGYITKQIEQFENNILDLPCAHSTVYLDIPPDEATRAMQNDNTRASLDQNELAPDSYKEKVRKIYLEQELETENYYVIDCMKDDKRISRKDMHDKIYNMWFDKFVNRHM
ncbi:thymidylate kinase [Emiliania huxleyi virus 202]|nr:thymidylate kinase [Emiliania huxleyi virus 202]AHA54509.1 putative thymidylate kinase [Emiliania huxleyi virus 18]AHA55549.1 putative thymidylate kinase [Emiliania huxleyi virus 156]